MNQWPALLCQHALQIMLNPEPRIICWGKELAVVYNEAALPLVSVMGQHPDQLGQPACVDWEDLVEQGVYRMFDQIMLHGQAVLLQNHHFSLQRPPVSARTSPASSSFAQGHEARDTHTRESYYTINLLPIFDASASVTGVLWEGNETTRQVVAARRSATLLSVEECSQEAATLKEMWRHVLDGLDQNVQDVPFALLYSRTNDPTAELMEQLLSLEGAIGLPLDHPVASLHESDTNLTAWIKKAWRSEEPVIVDLAELGWHSRRTDSQISSMELNMPSGTTQIDAMRLRGGDNSSGSSSFSRSSGDEPISTDESLPNYKTFIIPGRGFGDEVTSALILPIARLPGLEPVGVLIIGINPQQSYDGPYQTWARQLTESLARGVTSISVSDELRENRRTIREMTEEHARASLHLTQGKEHAEKAESLLRRMAESAPVGLAMFKPDGTPTWVNKGYAAHLNLRKEDCTFVNIKDKMHPDDAIVVDKAQEGKASPLEEFRVRREEHDANVNSLLDDDGKDYSYIMAGPSLLYDDAGELECIFGWTLDITHKKKAERLQAQRLKDQAQRIQDILEAKSQSENFIDMVSHEMRNPLSAIVQSAEFIVSSTRSSDGTMAVGNCKAILESAEVINLCAQHQKRIVDDLLTMSKLDAKLLLISRENVGPVSILQRMVQMYDGELKSADIETELLVDQSLNDMAIDQVMIDPSRLLQVLINLFTNAIKFTKGHLRRKITLTVSSLYARPTYGPHGGSYVPFRHRLEETSSHEIGGSPEDSSDNTVYLQFSVEDTGRGLSHDEMGALFQRFCQASPKTYGKYGGSGLGLFISRELLELQGGQIGVCSVLGEGTNFFCYVECTRPRSSLERSDKLLRRTSTFDIVQEVKRQRSDALLVVDDTWSGRLTSPPKKAPDISDDPDDQFHSILDLSLMHSPSAEIPRPKKLGVIHVLIVEDNKINQKVLTQQLKREGCITHTADDGGQALEFLLGSTLAIPQETSHLTQKHVEISVVLLDVEMPAPATIFTHTPKDRANAPEVMDGLTAARRIRELEREGRLRRSIPIIAITANARAEQRVKALDAGMNSVITKPFGVGDVMEKMRYWILETDARWMDE
ncbi:hypothetical protein FKW77_007621 [Venturia effusa]|uniref:Histidine kinase n=1 Tax=Venturia effusa TaxID=50376 RepID=A0A517L5T2_9PEZI|nr:hypothetical protein FKW77_007621 [Venturia effusa]